jgi:hypothetical protein
MMLSKRCPRCDGDLYLEQDLDGQTIVCIQCGSRQYPSFPRAQLVTVGHERPAASGGK